MHDTTRSWLRHAGAGALGTALLAAGGVGVGAVPYPYDSLAQDLGIAWVHGTPVGRGLARAACGVGALLLIVAWWRLRRALPALGARRVAVVCAAWVLPLLLAPPLLSRDVYAYAGQAHLVTVGLDPYALGPGYAATPVTASVDTIWQYTPSPYGPLFLWAAAHVPGVASGAVLTSVYGLRLLAVVGLAIAGVSLVVLARAVGQRPSEALWLGVANPFVLVHVAGGAHNDALMVAPVLFALALIAVRGPRLGSRVRPRRLVLLALGGALCGVGALVKAPALLALPFLPLAMGPSLDAPRVRRLLRYATDLVAVAAGCVAAMAALASLTGLGWGWTQTLRGGTNRPALLSLAAGLGQLGAALTGQDPPLVETPAYAVALTAVTALGAVAGALFLLRARPLGPARALGWGLLAAAVLAPVVQPWYLLWGLLPLAAAAVGVERRVLAVASTALALAVMPDGHSVVNAPLYGVPMLAVLLAAGGALLWSRRHDGADPQPARREPGVRAEALAWETPA